MSNPASKLQVRSKIWLEIDGEPVFGRGREELLHLIRKGSSINAAAMSSILTTRKNKFLRESD
jgi:molybdate transport system regulatory protein